MPVADTFCKLILFNSCTHFSGGSRISETVEGAPILVGCQPIILQNIMSKTAWNWKKLNRNACAFVGGGGGAVTSFAPLPWIRHCYFYKWLLQMAFHIHDLLPPSVLTPFTIQSNYNYNQSNLPTMTRNLNYVTSVLINSFTMLVPYFITFVKLQVGNG